MFHSCHKGYLIKLIAPYSHTWEKTTAANMEDAAARERQAAIDEGRFSKNGKPIIDVIGRSGHTEPITLHYQVQQLLWVNGLE